MYPSGQLSPGLYSQFTSSLDYRISTTPRHIQVEYRPVHPGLSNAIRNEYAIRSLAQDK